MSTCAFSLISTPYGWLTEAVNAFSYEKHNKTDGGNAFPLATEAANAMLKLAAASTSTDDRSNKENASQNADKKSSAPNQKLKNYQDKEKDFIERNHKIFSVSPYLKQFFLL